MPTALPKPWPKRPGGDFDARRVPALGMAGRAAAPLAELLDVIQRQVVPGHVQQAYSSIEPCPAESTKRSRSASRDCAGCA